MDSTNRPKPHPPVKKMVTINQIGTDKKVAVPADTQVTPPEKSIVDAAIDEMRDNQARKEGFLPPLPTDKKSDEKKPFVLKEHLTERPFKNHEGLQQLKESISDTKAETKPRPRYFGNRSKRTSRSKGDK